MPNAPLNDVYQRVTDQIIEAIEAGAEKWKMPWHHSEAAMRPVNIVSGKAYRGVNVLALWAAAQGAGYNSQHWATYKQWQEKGAQVKKGERSSLVVFWKITEYGAEETQTEAEDEKHGARRSILARGYPVFHAEQVDGYKPPAGTPSLPELPQAERIERAEQFFASLGADIRHGGGRAYFNPASDHIQMPPFALFREAGAYYATLGHEATHWTGAKSRLAREMVTRFGSEAYAGEELVAELGAAFLCADLALRNEPRPDHANYIASWLKALRSDPRALFTAAARAQEAADYLHRLQQSAPEPIIEAARDILPRPQQPAPTFVVAQP